MAGARRRLQRLASCCVVCRWAAASARDTARTGARSARRHRKTNGAREEDDGSGKRSGEQALRLRVHACECTSLWKKKSVALQYSSSLKKILPRAAHHVHFRARHDVCAHCPLLSLRRHVYGGAEDAPLFPFRGKRALRFVAAGDTGSQPSTAPGAMSRPCAGSSAGKTAASCATCPESETRG